ncbi:ABC transporter ATP-binding protein [Flavihumibacter petaseus]|uniref:Putative ABC transporter ATP-binding protein n=1 Tax=Flavihumibacter petaseus NBRC 106054 TaxID=1220578 RepID=A0A0E9MVZ9_9BACT|nr:ABC transporter ATP-binding protein [Flavihumibacter petaseus]GAO41678.1 putative ABC transporter ATP-binding protein [Flavihumibacter petaseus NBRC 106054]
MNSLSIDTVSVTWRNGVKALNDISLQFSKGMFGLLGPNGAGKSTLLKTIVGLQQPDKGKIFLNGIDLSNDQFYLRKQLGYLPQDFGVYPGVTAWDLLQHIAILKGVGDATARRKQVTYLLEQMNLSEYRNSAVHRFSGGMKQRFGVAQALIGNPQVILLDEPTAGLDPEERHRFNSMLSALSEELIVVLSTHLVEDVRNLCDNMAVIHQGRVVAEGKPAMMISALDGKIWSKKSAVTSGPEPDFPHRLISRQLIGKRPFVTVYAEVQPPGFVPDAPTLEHVYFHALNS